MTPNVGPGPTVEGGPRVEKDTKRWTGRVIDCWELNWYNLQLLLLNANNVEKVGGNVTNVRAQLILVDMYCASDHLMVRSVTPFKTLLH